MSARLKWCASVSAALGLWMLLPCQVVAQAKNRKPNIVILLADDMGYADVGFHGCKDIPTPNIDGLAKKGVRFTNGYVSGPYCSPTRAGLLTGRYQTRFGHEFNPGKGNGLPLTQKKLTSISQVALRRMLARGWESWLP